ncbi:MULTISPECIES: MGDG synthase family glycosyltransferase [unclassified Frankia]|uniref:MGDG synthase family glycosyltransferase n=1 Tax=unclassified Frankia TaxID=2632575 RepID=UPI00202587D0
MVVITASVGAGHDGAAVEWARRLRDHGFEVDIHDFLTVLGRILGESMRDAYETVLHRVPWVYALLFRLTALPHGAAMLARNLMTPFLSKLGALFPPDTVAVVTTYPMAGQLLGKLRRRGALAVPAFTFLTDFSVHRLCVAPGIDAYYVLHAVSAAQARALGATEVVITGPLVSGRFRPASAADRRLARERFGLPAGERLALLVAGSWGVGDVEHAATEIAATGVAMPVVVCGRNTALRERLDEAGLGCPLGWVEDMPALMQAVDVLVENAGGLTSLEAMACGLPVASYRPIPGHGRTNAAALDEAGVSTWIRTPSELRATLAELVEGPRGRRQRAAGLALFAADPTAVAVQAIEGAGRRDGHPGTVGGRTAAVIGRKGPLAAGNRWARRVVVAVATAVVVGWNMTVGTQLAVAHGFDAARPGGRGEVFVIVHPGPETSLDPAAVRLLQARQVAVAVDAPLLHHRPDLARTLAASGLTLVNAGGGPPYRTGIVGGRSAIRHTAAAVQRVGGRPLEFYLSNGDLDAVDLGTAAYLHETIVLPNQHVSGGSLIPSLRQGEIVLVECAQRPDCGLATTLAGLDRQTAGQPMRVGSLAELRG